MMERKDNMFWVGTIQDLGMPYAELYLKKDERQLFLFIRTSISTDKDVKYAAIVVSPRQVVDFMEQGKTMTDAFSHTKYRNAEIRNKSVFMDSKETDTSDSTFLFNNNFDPELSHNQFKMKVVLRRMLNETV